MSFGHSQFWLKMWILNYDMVTQLQHVWVDLGVSSWIASIVSSSVWGIWQFIVLKSNWYSVKGCFFLISFKGRKEEDDSVYRGW